LIPAVRGWIYQTLAKRVTMVPTHSHRPGPDPYGRPIKGPGTIDLDQDDYRPQ
jgi:UPF0716 protein FxsA